MVGSVSGRQPQQLPSSLHCVLQLRGGASTSSSSDDGLFGSLDVSSVGFNEAAGSGVGSSRGSLNGYGGDAVRRVSAGVLAREEGRRSWIFDHIVEQ